MTVTTIAPARGLARRTTGDPWWARPLLLGLLTATAVAYLWGLSRNQYGNDFYAAAVQAGTRSWKAFFFGSFDSSNFITVDKTPASLWVMEISARIFGFSPQSLLVPQVLEGVLSVAVLHGCVRRWFGARAGLVAGAVLAITPVAALMFRFDNPDALLMLLATCAAYALTRALEQERGATGWLVLAGALLGFGFLAKMLAAFLVLPGFALAYLWAGPSRLWRRVRQLLWSAAGIAIGGGWWVAIAQLTPASWRPYVGGSTNDSVLQLAIGYNGLGRLSGTERAGMASRPDAPAVAGRLAGHGGFGGRTGITRLFGPQFGGQVAWLLPTALLIALALLWVSRRSPRTSRVRAFALLWGGWLVVSGLTFSYMQGIIHPYYTLALAPAISALAGVGCQALAPGALAHGASSCDAMGSGAPAFGVPAREAPDRRPRPAGGGWAGRLFVALTLAVTGWWGFELLARSPSWLPWLRWVIVVTAATAAATILAGGLLEQRARGSAGARVVRHVPLGLTLVAGLAGPLAYSVQTIATPHTGGMPTAGPAVAGAFGGPGPAGPAGAAFWPGLSGAGPSGPGVGAADSAAASVGAASASGTSAIARGLDGPDGGFGALMGELPVNRALVSLVAAGGSGYRWVAATDGSMAAAPIELASGGDPVMAIGGFDGTDPAPTLSRFKAMVAARQIHYYIARATKGPASSSASDRSPRSSGSASPTGLGGLGAWGGVATPISADDPNGPAGLGGPESPGGPTGPGGFGRGPASNAIGAWVASHFTAQVVGGTTVYDLTRPAHPRAAT